MVGSDDVFSMRSSFVAIAWRRFLARAIDFFPVSLAVLLTLDIYAGKWGIFVPLGSTVLLVSLFRAVMLFLFRTTPGMSLLGHYALAAGAVVPSRGQLVGHEGRQFLRLRRGHAASYDGRIRIAARPFGWPRRLGTAAIGSAAAVVMVGALAFAAATFIDAITSEGFGRPARDDARGKAVAAAEPAPPSARAAARFVLPSGPGDAIPIDRTILVTPRPTRPTDPCDLLAGTAGDPFSVTPPVYEIDKAKVLPACEAAVRRDPIQSALLVPIWTRPPGRRAHAGGALHLWRAGGRRLPDRLRAAGPPRA